MTTPEDALAAFRAQWANELEVGVALPSRQLQEQVRHGGLSRPNVRRNALRARAEWEQLWGGARYDPRPVNMPTGSARGRGLASRQIRGVTVCTGTAFRL